MESTELAQRLNAIADSAPSVRERAADEAGDVLRMATLEAEARAQLVQALAEAAYVETDSDALESQLNALSDAAENVQYMPPADWDRFGRFMKTIDPRLLPYAVHVLGACGDPAKAEHLLPYLNSADDAVREAAEMAMAELDEARKLSPEIWCNEPGCYTIAVHPTARCERHS